MTKDETIRKKRARILLPKEKQESAAQRVSERKQANPDIYQLPPSKHCIQDLTEHFIKVEEGTRRILPKEKRRYVIYLRKSTDSEDKQVRSILDQKNECLELADRLGVIVLEEDIIEEHKSAKVSGKRPLFDDMLMGFKTGRYHGLISWSPDRISRNMKEAGEIIEMIDLEQIQDLHFKTYQFENNPNGKMLLGILFATSKQYSDKLSVDVKRGNYGNIREGKYNGVVKKGYFVDLATSYFVPDGYNWDLLREAVNMRLYQGKNNIEIAKFLNESHFSTRRDQDERYMSVKVDKQMVGDIFADTFYFGLYKYGDKLADLTEIYSFLPLITPDEYIVLNQAMAADFGKKYAGRSIQAQRLDYGLLRGKVICDFCDTPMSFQNQKLHRGKNAGRWVVSFYCRNKDCLRHNEAEALAKLGKKLSKSVRAKVVMAAIEWELRHCTKKSKKAYQMHIDKLQAKLAQDMAIAKRKLTEAESGLRKNEVQYANYQQFQVSRPLDYEKHHKGKLEHYEQLINVANHSITENKAKIEELKTVLPTEEEFYELTNTYLLKLLKTTDLMEQDLICNELVSNLRAGDDSVSVIKLNPPYDLLVDLTKISSGGRERT